MTLNDSLALAKAEEARAEREAYEAECRYELWRDARRALEKAMGLTSEDTVITVDSDPAEWKFSEASTPAPVEVHHHHHYYYTHPVWQPRDPYVPYDPLNPNGPWITWTSTQTPSVTTGSLTTTYAPPVPVEEPTRLATLVPSCWSPWSSPWSTSGVITTPPKDTP